MVTVPLGKPTRIASDVRIRFVGRGQARFRVQHTGGLGSPIPAWCDVTSLSDANADPRQDSDIAAWDAGFMAERVDGDCTFTYRRHTAHWLRILPLKEDDEQEIRCCRRYTIIVEPMTP